MNSSHKNSNHLNEILGLDKQTPGHKKAKVWIVATIVTVLILGVVIFAYPKNEVSLQYNILDNGGIGIKTGKMKMPDKMPGPHGRHWEVWAVWDKAAV